MKDKKKIEEFLEVVNNDDSVLNHKLKRKFEDGRSIYGFYTYHKYDLIIEIKKKEYQEKYPHACNILLNNFNKEKEKMYEFLDLVEKDAKIPLTSDKRKFKDGSLIEGYWYHNKNKIINLFNEPGVKEKYPTCYSIMMNRYCDDTLKILNRKINRIKFLCVCNKIDIDKNLDVISSLSLEEFVIKFEYLKSNNIPFTDEDGIMHPIFSADISSLFAKENKERQKKK